MTDNIVDFPGSTAPDMFGPENTGSALILEGRCIPNIALHKTARGVDFVLDHRLSFEFPEEWAYLAAVFAANAMAVGAGYAYLGGETKDRPFAIPCSAIGDISDIPA